MSETSVHTELALIRQRLDTVIDNHGKSLTELDVTNKSAHAKISVIELQVNTHEVKLSDLVYKSRGTFGNIFIIIASIMSATALFFTISGK